MFVQKLASCYDMEISKRRCHAITGLGNIGKNRAMLAMPQTYMNNSGLSVAKLLDYFDIDLSKLIVVYDDLDLDTGIIRIRKRGSHGGHNGMRSIIESIGTSEFSRIRIGIGPKPLEITVTDYVLGVFSKEQRILVSDAIDKSVDALSYTLENNIDAAMNKFN